MQVGVREKFKNNANIRSLLRGTHAYRLCSIKNDCYWGFHPNKGGKNKLAEILENLRREMDVNGNLE